MKKPEICTMAALSHLTTSTRLMLLMHPPPPPHPAIHSYNLWTICPLCGNLFFHAMRTLGINDSPVMLKAFCSITWHSGAYMARSIRPKLATFHGGCHGSGNHQVAVVGALGVSFGCQALTALICCRMFGEVPLFGSVSKFHSLFLLQPLCHLQVGTCFSSELLAKSSCWVSGQRCGSVARLLILNVV